MLDDEYNRVTSQLAHLDEPEFRVGWLTEWLTLADEDAKCAAISESFWAAAVQRSEVARSTWLTFATVFSESDAVRRLDTCVRMLSTDVVGLTIDRLWIDGDGAQANSDDHDEPPRRTEMRSDGSETLGARKTRGRTATRLEVAKLVLDSHPDVIAALLDNPVLTERDVSRIVTRRPGTSQTLRRVMLHPRWNTRTAVQVAVVNHPACPSSMALAWLPLVPSHELAAIARTPSINDSVRLLSRDIVRLRSATETNHPTHSA